MLLLPVQPALRVWAEQAAVWAAIGILGLGCILALVSLAGIISAIRMVSRPPADATRPAELKPVRQHHSATVLQ